MKEDKEIKRKKKSKKKKDFPQEKNEAASHKVQPNHSISPDDNAISCSIVSPSTEIDIVEKASEHGGDSAQAKILDPSNFIKSDTREDASQSATQDEVQTVVNNVLDNESHDTTETVSNAGTPCTENEASSILENEANNMPSTIIRQANGCSNCQKSIISDVEKAKILDPSNFIKSDTKEDASQSAKQDGVQTVVNNVVDNESHDTTETVSNAGTPCTENEGSSILENEANNMPSTIIRQANGYSNCQKSIISDVEHIENTSIYLPTEFSRDAGINHLKICLEKELKSSQLLRLQISALEDLIVIRDADETRTKTQVERLKTQNESLEKEILELKDMVKMLMLDRSKVLAKMVILQNGERVVDEVDASMDVSPVYQQIDDSTLDCTKEGSVFPSTSSTLSVKAVSEPSIQTTVTSTIVDDLVPEAMKPILQEKEHDTSAASQASDVCLEKHDPAGISPTMNGQRNAAVIVPNESFPVTFDGDKFNNQAGNLAWSEGSRKELDRKEALEFKDIEKSNSSVEIESISESEENNDIRKEAYLAPDNQLPGKSNASDNYQNSNPPKVKFSDAPLIGAPFRLVSFMTRYVSGADLAAN